MLKGSLSFDSQNQQFQERVGDENVLRRVINSYQALTPTSASGAFSKSVWLSRYLYEISLLQQLPVVLCLSGGLDSQAVLQSFLASGIKFEIAILKFKERYNMHDVEEALDIAQLCSVKVHVIDVDAIHFFESGQYMHYAELAETNSPQFSLHAWFAEQINGLPVFAGEPYYWFKSAGSENFYVPQPKEYAARHLLARTDRPCISHFFELLTELNLLFLKSPRWSRRDNAQLATLQYAKKAEAYRSMGFPVHDTARGIKFTGFEGVYWYFRMKHSSHDIYYFNKLFRQPLEKVRPNPDRLDLKWDQIEVDSL